MWVIVEKIKMLFFPSPADGPIMGHTGECSLHTESFHRFLQTLIPLPQSKSCFGSTPMFMPQLQRPRSWLKRVQKLPVFSLNSRQRNLWVKALIFSDEAKRFVLETFLVIQLQDAWHSSTPVKESDARKQMKAATWLKGIAEFGLKTEFGLYHWTFMRPNMIWKLFQ